MSPSPASERRDQRPAGSLPARMSPSALKKYDTCPRSYYYRYILKLPDPTGLPAIQGTVAHAILEELMQKPREERTVEWCHDQVERVWRDEYLQALQKGNPPLVKWEAWLTDAIASGELELTDEQLAITDEQFSDEQTEAHVFSLIRMFLDNAFKIERLTNFDPHATEIKLIKNIAGVPLLGIVDRLDRFESNGREYFAVSDYKGLAVDTPIPTPSGWTTMGAVQVGDEVFTADGTSTVVSGKSQVKHLPCYEIHFDDGSSIVCDEEHRWQVEHSKWPSHTAVSDKSRTTSVMTATELYEFKQTDRRSVQIPNASPLELPERDLPIDPYVLGLWLGDGKANSGEVPNIEPGDAEFYVSECTARGERTTAVPDPKGNGTNLSFPKPDPQRCVRNHAPDNTKGCNACERIYQGRDDDRFHSNRALRGRLAQLGLLSNKHVPGDYLRASLTQRLDLLRGLMDSDGHWNPTRQRCVFVNTEPALARAVEDLVAGMGWRFYTWEEAYTRSDGVEKTASYVMFRPVDYNPFLLPRKRDAVVFPKLATSRRRSIIRVEEVESVPTQCIAVEHDSHLYLAGRQMVPTHNTGKPTEQDAPWLYRDMFAMRVYALLVQEEFGVTPYQLRLLFLRCDDKEDGVVTLNVDEQMLEKTRIEVKRLYREIRTSHRRNDWPVMKKLNEKFCVHCPYYDICPAWNEDMPPLEEEQEMKQPDDRVA